MAESTTIPTRTQQKSKGFEWVTAYDPGLVTGVACGWFSDEEPLTVWGRIHMPYEELVSDIYSYVSGQYVPEYLANDPLHIVETFIVRTNNEFAPDTTALKVEGLLDLALNPGRVVYRDRTRKTQVPDKILKEHGLWVTGSGVDWTDGRDTNDAVIHMIGHVAKTLHHMPTLRRYFK